MSVLVTGAAGFIGSHIVDALLERGEAVVGLDSFDDFYARRLKESNLERALSHESFQIVELDVRDEHLEAGIPDSVTAIVHLAARAGVRPSIERPILYADVNLMGTIRLLELARRRGIRAFLFASSSSVYGNNTKVPFSEADPVDRPISPYAATKKAGELLCHTSTHLDGITTACLRLFTVYGPRQRPDLAIRKFSELLGRGSPIPMFGDGSTSRDYTFVDDICGGLLSALDWARSVDAQHEVINLGNSKTVTLREMIETLSEAMGIRPTIEQLPLPPGDVRRTYADISKASRMLGYRPTTDLGDGIQKFLRWREENGT